MDKIFLQTIIKFNNKPEDIYNNIILDIQENQIICNENISYKVSKVCWFLSSKGGIDYNLAQFVIKEIYCDVI